MTKQANKSKQPVIYQVKVLRGFGKYMKDDLTIMEETKALSMAEEIEEGGAFVELVRILGEDK